MRNGGVMNDADHRSFTLLLAAALVVSLVLTLVGPAQAREEEGVVTIQAASPKTPTVGQPYTFTVFVKNNSVAQRVDLEDLLPTSVSLISATPSQGNCDYRRDSASGRDVVQCAFGVVRSESTAEAEIVVTPTAPGNITNTATATAEISPAIPANSSSATVRVKPVPAAGA
jgi:uncharacterized repeat protein (TIGR01451 family)